MHSNIKSTGEFWENILLIENEWLKADSDSDFDEESFSIQPVQLIKKKIEKQLKDKNFGDATTDVNSILVNYYL